MQTPNKLTKVHSLSLTSPSSIIPEPSSVKNLPLYWLKCQYLHFLNMLGIKLINSN